MNRMIQLVVLVVTVAVIHGKHTSAKNDLPENVIQSAASKRAVSSKTKCGIGKLQFYSLISEKLDVESFLDLYIIFRVIYIKILVPITMIG